MSDIDAKRAARRAAMPICTAFLEEFAEFSPQMIYAIENGITYGKAPQDENVYLIPADFRPWTPPKEKLR